VAFVDEPITVRASLLSIYSQAGKIGAPYVQLPAYLMASKEKAQLSIRHILGLSAEPR